MKKFLKSGATALAAAGLVLTAAGAAQADAAKVKDAANDTWRYSSSDDSYEEARSPLNGDIAKTVVKHGSRKLTITTTFKRLAKRDNSFQSVSFVKVRRGETYAAIGYAGPGDWNGDHGFFTVGPQSGRTAARGMTECANMTHKINYRKDRVTLTVPRGCFDGGRKVRVRSLASATSEDRTWIDNGHNRGHSTTKGSTRFLSAG